MKFSFFKLPKAKPFEYKPLYYDPEKEKIKNIKEKYENEDVEQIKERLRADISQKWVIGKNRAKQPRGFINQRNLIIYIIITLLLLYLILK